MGLYIHMYMHMHKYVYIYIYVCIHMPRLGICAGIYIYVHINMYIHTWAKNLCRLSVTSLVIT